jgi:hypothetical protein
MFGIKLKVKPMQKSNTTDISKSWVKKIFQKARGYQRVENIAFQGLLHARAANVLLFPYPHCKIDHEEIKVTKLTARLYNNFLVVDGRCLIKSFFTSNDDLLRLEQMEADFLTTLELPGLLSNMRIDFGAINPDYFFVPLALDITQTTFQNEVVLEIPYIIIKHKTAEAR